MWRAPSRHELAALFPALPTASAEQDPLRESGESVLIGGDSPTFYDINPCLGEFAHTCGVWGAERMSSGAISGIHMVFWAQRGCLRVSLFCKHGLYLHQKCASKGIARQGTALKQRNHLRKGPITCRRTPLLVQLRLHPRGSPGALHDEPLLGVHMASPKG